MSSTTGTEALPLPAPAWATEREVDESRVYFAATFTEERAEVRVRLSRHDYVNVGDEIVVETGSVEVQIGDDDLTCTVEAAAALARCLTAAVEAARE
jgi:hypothetical protein